MWDKVKEYFTVVFAQGIWWGKKGKIATEWVKENKTTLYVIAGIIVVIVILIYVPIPRGRQL